jgi:hypothetical protein
MDEALYEISKKIPCSLSFVQVALARVWLGQGPLKKWTKLFMKF